MLFIARDTFNKEFYMQESWIMNTKYSVNLGVGGQAIFLVVCRGVIVFTFC